MADMTQYLWMVIVGFMFGFAYAFGIGANDVANAFGTVVASKSLTLKQAVLVAACFEFLGALLLGASVTNTVRSKIFDVELYDDEPEILLLGMFSAIITGTLMLLTATAFALPVSTTHTIIGSIMGFSISAKGFSSINWDVAITIFISWAASPLVAGVLAFLLFGAIRMFVLKSEHPFDRAYYTFPVVLTLTVFINVFFILYKGFNNFGFVDEIPIAVSVPASFGAGLLLAAFWIWPWGPWAKRRVLQHMTQEEAAPQEGATEADGEDPVKAVDDAEAETEALSIKQLEDKVAMSEPSDVQAKTEAPQGFFRKSLHDFGEATFNQDLQSQSLHESKRANEIWDAAETYDPQAEQLFTYVQVFTSCMDSFAHGANDVANAMAPVSAILLVYQTGELSSKAPVPKWILAIGGLGIVAGLMLYGYKVIKSIGFKISMMSPSRGSMAELSTALIVVTASFVGIPVSTTQAQVGAVAGIGLVGGRKNVQWLFFLRICVSWVVVFFSAVIVSAGIFSMFAYTPSLAE